MEEMCIWKVNEDDRRCDLCSYNGGCEVREKKETIEEAGRRYLSVMYGIIGRDVREKTRERSVVYARDMVFYQLQEDGFSQPQIGSFFGFDHATVFHGKQQMKNVLAYSSMYPYEMSIWEKFQKSIAI